jgi:hypothetical protein
MAYLKYDCSAGQQIPFMELHLQELAIGPHPEPDEYKPHPTTTYPEGKSEVVPLLNQALHHEQAGVEGSRWSQSVSFTLLPLYCQGKGVLVPIRQMSGRGKPPAPAKVETLIPQLSCPHYTD